MTENKKTIPLDWASAKAAAASQNVEVVQKYITDIGNSLFFREGTSSEDIIKQLNCCIEVIQAIKPQDILESQLIGQMVCAHNTAIECLRRANLPNQTFEGRKTALDFANKFMRLYMDQLSILNKHRGKGQQKVTVEYVNVEAGGQAIVGHVSTRPAKNKKYIPKALSHQPALSTEIPSKDPLQTGSAIARKKIK